jgi:hypothetical protein
MYAKPQPRGDAKRGARPISELELELIQTQMTQKPLLWVEVGTHAVRKRSECNPLAFYRIYDTGTRQRLPGHLSGPPSPAEDSREYKVAIQHDGRQRWCVALKLPNACCKRSSGLLVIEGLLV